MPDHRRVWLRWGDQAGRGSEALGSSEELPAAAGGPAVAAEAVAADAEDRVLGAVVVPAEALAVLGAGPALRPRDPVVLVGAPGGSSAAGEHAGPVARLEVTAQPRWELVRRAGQVLDRRWRAQPLVQG